MPLDTQVSKTSALFRFHSHCKNVWSQSLQLGCAGVSRWNMTSTSVDGTQEITECSLLSLSCVGSAGLIAIISRKKKIITKTGRCESKTENKSTE